MYNFIRIDKKFKDNYSNRRLTALVDEEYLDAYGGK